MKKQPRSASDSSHEKKSEMSILSILILSLFIGLIAGAGVDRSHILPIALVSAVVLFINRKKIVAGQSDNDAQQNIEPTEDYYAWPELGRFTFVVAAESYQSAIRQLIQKNAINPDEDSDPKTHILKAYLIPDSNNPYDSNAVRIDIDNRTIGHLNREQAHHFHQKLDEKKLSHQITTCNAVITIDNDANGKAINFGVRLDIELFANNTYLS
jgi:hypothetical protein